MPLCFDFVVEIRICEAEFLHDVAFWNCTISSASHSPLFFDLVVEIRVREAELLHDVALELLHLLGFLVLDMVIT